MAFVSHTDLFKNAKSPEYTAGRGYEAMEAGKLEEITEFGLKMTIKAGLPVMPLRLQLKTVAKMQAK